MSGKLLLTSFQTWLPHQKSNSSDDLLKEITELDEFSTSLTFLRQLPVDVPKASRHVIAKIEELQPDGVICCGMAESRTNLTVESCAICGDTLIKTSIDLEKLVAGLAGTSISHNAGRFVCEGLYYEVLNYLQEHNQKICCIFVHVPVLTQNSLPSIVADFRLIIEQMASFSKIYQSSLPSP